MIGHRGSGVDVLNDSRTLLFPQDSYLFVIPVSVTEFASKPTVPAITAPLVFQGAYVYDLSLADGFQLLGKITHNVPAPGSDNGEYPNYGSPIKRSLCLDRRLYTLSHYSMFIHNLADMEELRRIYYRE